VTSGLSENPSSQKRVGTITAHDQDEVGRQKESSSGRVTLKPWQDLNSRSLIHSETGRWDIADSGGNAGDG